MRKSAAQIIFRMQVLHFSQIDKSALHTFLQMQISASCKIFWMQVL